MFSLICSLGGQLCIWQTNVHIYLTINILNSLSFGKSYVRSQGTEKLRLKRVEICFGTVFFKTRTSIWSGQMEWNEELWCTWEILRRFSNTNSPYLIVKKTSCSVTSESRPIRMKHQFKENVCSNQIFITCRRPWFNVFSPMKTIRLCGTIMKMVCIVPIIILLQLLRTRLLRHFEVTRLLPILFKSYS